LTSCRVTDDHIKLCAVVSDCSSRCRITRRRRARNVRVVFLPLVAEGRRAGRRHAKGCRLSNGHALIRWLRGDCRCRGCRAHSQRCHRAGLASGGIANDHVKLRAVVGRYCHGSGVACCGRARNICIVFLPLVTQWRRSGRRHAKRRRLSNCHTLIRWLRRDSRRDCCRVHCQCGHRTGYTSRRIAYNYIEFCPTVACDGRRGRVGRCRGPANIRAVLQPLITQRRCTRGHHAERRRLPGYHNLARWLRRDGRRHRLVSVV